MLDQAVDIQYDPVAVDTELDPFFEIAAVPFAAQEVVAAVVVAQ